MRSMLKTSEQDQNDQVKESAMKANRKGLSTAAVVAVLGITILSASAVALSRVQVQERVVSAGHVFLLPIASEVTRTLLPDGRMLEIHGKEGVAYLINDHERHPVQLPEVRRFGTATVMPGGEVLLWGGIDAQGHVLDSGEWFEPSTARFAPTGVLALPARAGHSLTLLTDGSLLMVGGWQGAGKFAANAVVWEPLSNRVSTLTGVQDSPRLLPQATLLSDGSVRIAGGIDEQGRSLQSEHHYQPDIHDAVATHPVPASHPITATLLAPDATNIPIRGKLVLRFATPVDVQSVNTHTITLIGPEGTVPLHVVGTEGGRLAFIQPGQELYPTSRYTLFAKGMQAVSGGTMPYQAVGFTTGQPFMPGVASTLDTSYPAKSFVENKTLPPLYVMAGGGHDYCNGSSPKPLCRKHSMVQDGAWYPGDDNVADATGGHWRLYHAHQRHARYPGFGGRVTEGRHRTHWSGSSDRRKAGRQRRSQCGSV